MQFEDMMQTKSVEWRWFLASTQCDKNHCRQAKCKKCNKVLSDRLEPMRKHLLHDCKQLSAAERSTYVMEAKSSNKESGQTPESQQPPNATSMVPQKRPAPDSISQYFSVGPERKH